MVVRRVYHKPANPLFDVYLERCGIWAERDKTKEDTEPDFSALIPMAVANRVGEK